ncbi:MAG: desulfoferrodoxin [Candidatus Woesearchaeota archaeon]
MTQKLEVYRCKICGNIVEVLHPGKGTLVCCNQPMEKLNENTVDASVEKHVPVIEKNENETLVRVGSIEHPMIESHYIEWIEILEEDEIHIKFLKPNQKPEYLLSKNVRDAKARAYCNLHGLWKN